MTLVTGNVGSLVLPIEAGGVDEKFEDPAIEMLLDFTAFVIKTAIDAKLNNLKGTAADAVPVDNRFTFDPEAPRGISIKLPVPALFMWWKGPSELVEWSSIYYMRKRQIGLLYVFPELPSTDEFIRRSGLMNAVDASLYQASLWQGHPEYHGGMSLRSMMGSYACLNEWKYLGGEVGRFGVDEGPGADRRVSKHSGIDRWALKGAMELHERVTPTDLTDGDIHVESELTINASDGEHSEAIEFMIRALEGPDGADE